MSHVLEVAESKGIVKGPMLGKALDVIGTLGVMESSRRSVVGSRKQPSLAVKFHTPRISAALGEKLELSRLRVIAPDGLSQKFHSLYVRGSGAPLGAVQPAVRSPVQAVGHRVSVFQSETGEMHFWVSVRDVVPVTVRIKQ